jgi:hypothetical protein
VYTILLEMDASNAPASFNSSIRDSDDDKHLQVLSPFPLLESSGTWKKRKAEIR